MITSILSFIFTVVLFLITIASWLLLIYVILALVAPQNQYTLLMGKYIQPILTPLRTFLYRLFPKLRNTGVDFSPLLLYLLIQVLSWLVRLLRNILI